MDFYKVLGVEKNATKEDVRKAYKSLAVKYHPDRNKNNPEAGKKFKEISSAYETLYDDNKRRIYDLTGTGDSSDITDTDAYNIFNSFFSSFGDMEMGDGLYGSNPFGIFNGLNNSSYRPTGLKFTIHTFSGLPNSDAFNFNNILNNKYENTNSGNTNSDNNSTENNHFNSKCKSYHSIPNRFKERYHRTRHNEKPADTIYNCSVNLEDMFNNCTKVLKIVRKRYYGKQCQTEKKTLKIHLSEREIIFKNEGDEAYKCKNFGDIIVKINDKPNKRFTRINEHDLVYEKEISLYEYYAGNKFKFKHMDGRTLTLRINRNDPLRTYNNYLKLYGEGLPHKSGARGDLFIKLKIHLPHLDEKVVEKLKRYFEPLHSTSLQNETLNRENADEDETEEIIDLVHCEKDDIELI